MCQVVPGLVIGLVFVFHNLLSSSCCWTQSKATAPFLSSLFNVVPPLTFNAFCLFLGILSPHQFGLQVSIASCRFSPDFSHFRPSVSRFPEQIFFSPSFVLSFFLMIKCAFYFCSSGQKYSQSGDGSASASDYKLFSHVNFCFEHAYNLVPDTSIIS